MKNKDNEQWLKDLTSQYVKLDGEHLKKELLGADYPAYNTVRLDKKVARRLKKSRIKYYSIGIAAMAAACLCILLLNQQFSSDQAGQDLLITEDAPAHSIEEEYEVLKLTARLPDEFSVSHIEQDQAQTIYYIQNEKNDDVVLTMEKNQLDQNYKELTEITFEGDSAYGASYEDYSILAFEKDGISYVLTCKYDINTLVSLIEKII